MLSLKRALQQSSRACGLALAASSCAAASGRSLANPIVGASAMIRPASGVPARLFSSATGSQVVSATPTTWQRWKWTAFVVPAGLPVYLGFWQMDRRQEKIETIRVREANFKRDEDAPETYEDIPLSTKSDLERLTPEDEGKVIRVSGQFRIHEEVLVGPRSIPHRASLSTRKNKIAPPSNASGYYVLQPFVADDGTEMIVNNGWIPMQNLGNFGERRTRQFSIPITITAIVSKGERGDGMFVPPNSTDLENPMFFSMRPAEIAARFGISNNKIVLDRIAPESVSGYPIPKSQDDYRFWRVTPFTHACYATTWFSIAFAWSVMMYLRFRVRPVKIIKPR